MFNDIYEKKPQKVIFVLGNVFKSEEKDEYILLKEIENEELEHQKYVNKPCGTYYIDKKKRVKLPYKRLSLNMASHEISPRSEIKWSL